MASTTRRPVSEYLAQAYPFDVAADPDGGYLIRFPDLPGCFTQVESLEEVGPMAEEIRTLWIETAYDQGMDIPAPSMTEEYSGKFNLRIPRCLHRRLANAAKRDGISLNQYVVMVLSQGGMSDQFDVVIEQIEMHRRQVEQSLTSLSGQINEIHARMTSYQIPAPRS